MEEAKFGDNRKGFSFFNIYVLVLENFILFSIY